jgi:PAS domain S-box-containing protein
MERQLTLDPTGPRAAREFVRDALESLGRTEDIEVATLLVSELVTNATLHAGTGGRIRVSATDSKIRVEVSDGSPAAPVMRARDVEAEHGRGMLLVEGLADAWGVDVWPGGGGKAVWFELGAVDDFGDAADDGETLRRAFANLMPRVLHDAPAAIVLVDLEAGTVTFANSRAQEMAPSTRLPCGIDAWAAAADLRDPSGVDLGDSGSPLSRVASGQPVAGEPVTVADAGAGPAGRRMLWVTGFPLAGVPTLERQALVVLFEMSGSGAEGHGVAADTLQAMRDRAVIATDISFTISDPLQDDDPLVWANPAFTRVTGYELEEAAGRNCRFLQGAATDPEAVAKIRRALEEDEPVTVTMLNYRKDGTAFWNELSISPVFDAEGRVIHHVGVQADVTARVQLEQEREAAYRAERQARAEAEHARTQAESAHARMALLAEVTTVLTATLDVDEALARLAALPVPVLADWCTVELSAASGGAPQRFTSRADGSSAEEAPAASNPIVDDCPPLHAALEAVLAGGEAVWLDGLDTTHCGDPVPDAAIVVPLRARRRMLGAMVWVMTAASGRHFDTGTFDLAKDFARRAGLAVDNARLYTREHELAEQLQRSLLPTLPRIPGLEFAERYLAASERAEVGGDWFDALPLPDGAVGLAIGDVMGHDMRAAAAMSQLRSVLRSYAWEGDGVADVLERLDRLVQGLEMAQLATAIYARLEPPRNGGVRILHYANAGHLPPLLLGPGGRVTALDDGRSVLLGAATEAERAEAAVPIHPGSTLLLYTDGLVERRGEDLTAALEHLGRVVAGHDPTSTPEALCDLVLDELVGESERADDIALLAVTLR